MTRHWQRPRSGTLQDIHFVGIPKHLKIDEKTQTTLNPR